MARKRRRPTVPAWAIVTFGVLLALTAAAGYLLAQRTATAETALPAVAGQRDAAVDQAIDLSRVLDEACRTGTIPPAYVAACLKGAQVQVDPIPAPPGTPGATGTAGGVGPAGPSGFGGLPGLMGVPGEGGAPGERGTAGGAGAIGGPGADGAPGQNGASGTPGATGAPGVAGPAGQAAPTPVEARFSRAGDGSCTYVTTYSDGTQLRSPAGDAACPPPPTPPATPIVLITSSSPSEVRRWAPWA